jgi:hypothetical protein
MSEEKIAQEVQDLAEEAKQPGTFNLLEAIKDRAYPTENINVYLDEETAYEASVINEKLKEVEEPSAEYKKLKTELDSLIKKLEESKYVFTITGISEGKREELYEESVKVYPLVYTEEKNPFTGEIKKVEEESKERDRLFTNMLWSAHIKKITSPSGQIQEALTTAEIKQLRDVLPLAAVGSINQAIDKIRAATAVFMFTVDEDFLAKS